MPRLVKVYRGLASWPHVAHTSPEALSSLVGSGKSLGIHWSTDPIIAYHFAQLSDNPGDPAALQHATGKRTPEQDVAGMVLEGYAPHSSIVHPGTPEWEDLRQQRVMFGPEHSEQEVTVRKGDPIHIVRQHLIGRQFDPSGIKVVEHPTGVRGIA